jgi:hypothetical protein
MFLAHVQCIARYPFVRSLPFRLTAIGFTSKRGKLLLAMSIRRRWPALKRLQVAKGVIVTLNHYHGTVAEG